MNLINPTHLCEIGYINNNNAYMAACSGGFTSTSSGRAKGKCCSCNGVNAICVKSKSVCSCCLPMNHNRCANYNPMSAIITLAESPVDNLQAVPRKVVTCNLPNLPTLEVSFHALSTEDPHESAAAVSNESNNAGIESCLFSNSVLLAMDMPPTPSPASFQPSLTSRPQSPFESQPHVSSPLFDPVPH